MQKQKNANRLSVKMAPNMLTIKPLFKLQDSARQQGGTGMMSKLASQLAEKADHTIAVAMINLDTFEALGIWHSVGYFTEAYINMVALAAAELFRGPRIIKVEELIAAQRNQPFRYHIDEYYFHTSGTHHFMMLVPETSIMVVFITPSNNDRETDRNALIEFLPLLQPHCPEALPVDGFNC